MHRIASTTYTDLTESIGPFRHSQTEEVNQAWAIEQAERKLEMAGPTASLGKVEKPNELV